jgi:hypothetical protein
MTADRYTRRAVLKALLSGAAAAASVCARGVPIARADVRPRLYVFVPADIQSHVLQRLLAEAMPSVDVTAFGRFRDFEAGLDEKPDGALTLQPTLKSKGLAVTLAGTNGGDPLEPYVLMSVGKGVDPTKISSVGAVDILGRQGMRELVAELLGASPAIERVTKVDDLLPLLQLASVDAVLLQARLVGSLQSRSKLDLRTSPTRGGVGLPALAVLTPAGAPLQDAVRQLNPRVMQQLGVSRWD